MSALVAATAVSCNDLDTEPMGQYITLEQKDEAVEATPDLSSAGAVSIMQTMYTWATVYSDSYHFGFGWPGVMIFLDSRGIDMVGVNSGYNWFSSSCELSDCTNNSYVTTLAWNTLYKQILACNTTAAGITEDTDEPIEMFFRGQALAIRAFDYFMLAQMYQHTYKGHESMACVPIITDKNMDEAAANGCARNTVAEVYAQIMSDINEAVGLIEQSGVSPEDVLDAGEKRFMSAGAAYGLRARINLVMNNWADAKNDALQAIAKSGATPYTLAQASTPAFAELTDNNMMWGIAVSENDRVVTTGICNWPSHMNTLAYGYSSVGAWRSINTTLFASIPATDVRKGWFLDGTGVSANLTAQQQSYCSRTVGAPAYAVVKFAPYQNVLGTSNNATDIPLMRVEEMHYIAAEAQAMGGDPAGASAYLTNFVSTYRDPSYSFSSSDATAVQDEVWNQRRVEFWGEGISYFDIVRLQKPIDRRGGGFPAAWTYDIPAGAQINVFPIPQGEINANKLINPGDNNESVTKPSPVR